MADSQGFVLTRQWRDTSGGVELEFWLATASGPVKLRVPRQQPLFFLADEQLERARPLLARFHDCDIKPVALRDFALRPVRAVYFSSQRSLREARDLLLARQLDPLESDINPCDRFLMERFIRGGLRFLGAPQPLRDHGEIATDKVTASDYCPALKIISLDIETAMDDLALYSIAVYAVAAERAFAKVFMVADLPVADDVAVFPDEARLMQAFLLWLADYDPDIIIGWNVINFDMWYLERICQRHRLPFALGRDNSAVHWRMLDEEGQRRVMVAPGRVVIDGIELLKTATWHFESYALNAVAAAVLGESKLIAGDDRGGKITELFHRDKPALAQYNVQDCRLVWDIFQKLKLIDFAVARTRMTGLPLDRIGGSVAAFDFRYLPLLHREQFVAPNGHLLEEIEHSPGGFVMNSRPGLYRHVLVLDFKSLYPSIIRSFRIDPVGMAIALHSELEQSQLVPGFRGAWFARERTILPKLIEELWQLRDQAKLSSDKAQSQAIKILMNSFYGVLGAKGCRFFDTRLASSITLRGHQIIQQTAAYIEQQGWSVIYGDTDSVFVWLRDVENDAQAVAIGRQLQAELNQWWRRRLRKEYGVDSALELEFETHFQRFLMPTVRGSDQGSKKRYAGLIEHPDGRGEVIFKGLETVRTDWTPLARTFQQELFRRIFADESYRNYIAATVAAVRAGELDNKLVYRKRLRQRLDDYQRNVPPHVQAARKAVAQAGLVIRRGDWVEYLITVSGPEPLVLWNRAATPPAIDYQHYIDKQLAPVADSILYFHDDSLGAIIAPQIQLFS